jgi:Methyltransferase domain
LKAEDKLKVARMPVGDVREVVVRLERDASLWEACAVRRRLEALDELDACGGESNADLRARLEAANAAVYAGIRREPQTLLKWIGEDGSVAPGLSYDWQDELLSGVLALDEPRGAKAHADGEMVFYQPTPVRHVMELISTAGIADRDVVVDLGSGLGHVPLLVGMLTGARCVGIEVDAAYVACARECAERLGLSGRVQFVEEDARRADFADGTVFYLYTPFMGGMLRDVLERLRAESLRRAIRVCTLGPCAEVVARETWLRASGPVGAGRVSRFRSAVELINFATTQGEQRSG